MNRLNGESRVEHRVDDVADVRAELQGLLAERPLIEGGAAIGIVLVLHRGWNNARLTALTRMFWGPSSRAKERVSPSNAPFDMA